MGVGGDAIIKVLFGLNIKDSKKNLIQQDVVELNKQLAASKDIKIKLPVMVDPDSLKSAIDDIQNQLKNITLDGIDLSKAVKNAKISVGISDASLDKLGTKMDTLTQSINTLNQTLSGKAGSIQNIMNAIGKSIGATTGTSGTSNTPAVTRAGMNRQGIKQYSDTGGYYIGAENPKRTISARELVSGHSEAIQGDIFGTSFGRELKDKIKFSLDKETGALSKEAADGIKASLPALAKSVFDKLADDLTNKGESTVNRVDYPLDYDEFFNKIAEDYFNKVDSYVKGPDIDSVKKPKYDWDSKAITNSAVYKTLQEEAERTKTPKLNSDIYRETTEILKKRLNTDSEAFSFEPLNDKLIDELDKTAERIADKEERAEKNAQQQKEDLKVIADKMGAKENDVTPLGQEKQHLKENQQKSLDEAVESGAISKEDALETARALNQQNRTEKMAEDYKKSQEKVIEVTERFGEATKEFYENDVANVQKANAEKAKQDQEYNEIREKNSKKHVAQTKEETQALQDEIDTQRKRNEEFRKNGGIIYPEKSFDEMSSESSKPYVPDKESGAVSQAILKNMPKDDAKLTGSAAQLSKLTSLFERLGSARSRGDLVDAEKTYKELDELIGTVGEKALKLYKEGSVWNEAKAGVKESGVTGSADIRKATQEATRQALRSHLGNYVQFDEDGIASLVQTASQKASERISSTENKYRSVLEKSEIDALNKLRYNAGKGNWGEADQSELDTLVSNLESKFSAMEAKEQEALQARIQASNDLVSIARDTSLSIEQQFQKAAGTYGYKDSDSVPNNIKQQIARAMGLNIDNNGNLSAIDNRDEFLRESAALQDKWRKRAYPTLDADFAKEIYNTIGDDPNKPYTQLMNRISRQRFGYPVAGGHEESIGNMIDESMLSAQAKSLSDEIDTTVNILIDELKTSSSRWKSLYGSDNATGAQDIWSTMLNGEVPRGQERQASIVREIVEGMATGKVGKDTAIKMFDLQETQKGLAMMETGKKLLTDIGFSQEATSKFNAQSLSALGDQIPSLEQIINLAEKYGVEWELIVDRIKNLNGEYVAQPAIKLGNDDTDLDKLDSLEKEIRGSGLRDDNVFYGEDPTKKSNAYRTITKDLKAIKVASTDATNAQKEFAKATEDAANAEQKMSEASENQGSKSLSKYGKELSAIEDKYRGLINFSDKLKKKFESLQESDSTGNLTKARVKEFEDSISKVDKSNFDEYFKNPFEGYIKQAQDAGNWTRSLQANWNEMISTMDSGGAIPYNKIEQFRKSMQKATTDMSMFEDTAFKEMKSNQLGASFDTLGQKMTRFGEGFKTVLRMNPDLAKAFGELQRNFNEFNTATGRTEKNFSTLNTTFNELRTQAYNMMTPIQKLATKIKNVFGERLMFMASTMVVSQIFGQFKTLYTAVSDVDKAMTELKKVTDLTADSYDSFLKRATSQARELGATVSDYVDATADFARLGYNMSDAENLAKTATVYKNVGDGIDSIGTASESVISTMKAFGIEAKNSMDIVDAFNEVGNNFAISSTGIGEALGNSASALAAANNDLNESIALVVAGNDVVQDPSKVGTALKTISMYLRAAKLEAQDAGESVEGMAESASKLREKLLTATSGRVDVMLDSKTFKSTYQILKELSEVWDDLADVDRANITELIGGKRNANVISSILTNFEDAEAVIKTIAGDAGSAMREQEKWLDSIEGKTQQLKASGQTLAVDLINTDTAKTAIEAITGLINVLDWFAKNKAIAGAIASFAASFYTFTHIQSVAIASSNGLKLLGTTMEWLKNIFSNFKNPFNTLKNAFNAVEESAEKVGESLEYSVDEIGQLHFAEVEEVASKTADTAATEANTVATKANAAEKNALTASTKGATTASTAFAAAISVVTFALSAGLLVYGLINNAIQKHNQEVEDAKKRYEEVSKSVEDYAEKIKKARKELSEAETEQARYEKTEELRDIQEELVNLYGAQAEQLDLINGKLDVELEKVKNLSKEEAKRYLGKANEKPLLGGIFGNSDVEKLEQDIKNSYAQTNLKLPFGLSNKYLDEISKIVEDAGGKMNATSLVGNLDTQKRSIDALFDYINIHEDAFDKKTRQAITNTYNDIHEKADSLYEREAPLAEAWINGYSAEKGLDDEYAKYIEYIDKYKKALSSNDLSLAAKTREDIKDLYNSPEFKQMPSYVRKYLQQMYFDAAPYKMRVELDIINNGAQNDKTLNELLEPFKDSFGKIDISKAKANTAAWQKITNAAQQYGYTVEDVIDAINKYNGIKLDDKFDTSKSKNSIADQIDKILEAEPAFDQLQKIYNDVKDGGQFDFGALRKKDFIEGFKDVEGAYNEFLETVAKYPNNLAKTQEAFNKLTTEYIKQKGILEGLTEENKEITIAYLKNIGVANAEEVVNQKLNASITVTSDEYKKLQSVLGDTVKATETANGAFKIESDTMKKLGVSAEDMARIVAAAQAGMTFTTIEEAKKRITAMQEEAKIYSKLYSAIQFVSKSNNGMDNSITGGIHNGFFKNEAKDKFNEAYYDSGIDKLPIEKQNEIISDLKMYAQIEENASEALKELDKINAKYTPPKTGKSKSGSGGSGDKYLENWKEEVKVKKELLEQDQITEQQYYDWLRDAYKKQGGPGWSELSAEQQKKYRDEVAAIESELYKWEKDQIQKSIDEQDAILKNKHANGLISEAEYQKQLAKVTEEGYNELRRKVEEEDLFGVDTTERLNAETELLDKIKSAHNAAYDAEIKDLEHLRAMNLITDEQYYAQHAALVAKYYAGEKMYAEELKEEEEKLYKERIDLVKKYSAAAKDAISSIMNIGKSLADAVNDLVTGLIDANSSNFDLQKNLLSHALKMNYITEEEYYKKLEDLYTTYYKSKEIYLDEYWENQEEIHEHEMDMLDKGASAMESIHAKVVDLIKSELEDAKDAIDETKDKYLDLIDIRKKALEKEKDENDYEKGRVEKLNSIAELQRQVNALANDTTAKGMAAYQKAYAELLKKQRELKEYDEDRAYDVAMDQLDAEADAYEKSAKKQTDAIDKQLEDNEWLVNEAWVRLKGMNTELYDQLIDYTHKHSTEIKDSVTGEWEVAKSAFEDYINNVKEGYYSVEDILAHPENYYMGNPLDAFNEKAGKTYGEMRDAERAQDSSITKKKEIQNYAKVMGEFVESLADIMGDSFQSVAGILNTLFPSPVTDLLVDGADGLASALGMVGINNSLLSTAMAVGGITGIVESLGGLQTLAEGGTELGGVAIGGENVEQLLSLVQAIGTYQQGIGTTNELLQLLLGATAAGPTDGSSVVSGIAMIGAVMTALLGVGTLLAGGGGAGATTLFSLLGGFTGLLTNGSLADMQTATSLSGIGNLVLNIANYALRLIGSADATTNEIGGLKAFLLNSWRTVHGIIQGILGGGFSLFNNDDGPGVSSTAEVLNGLTGTLGVIGSAIGTAIENNNPYQSVSFDNLPAGTSSSFAKMLGTSMDLAGTVMSAVGEIGAKVLPNIVSSRTGDVTVSPIFNIESHDPDGVANAVLQLMPRIADYTISTMMDSASNRGVKRGASALI